MNFVGMTASNCAAIKNRESLEEYLEGWQFGEADVQIERSGDAKRDVVCVCGGDWFSAYPKESVCPDCGMTFQPITCPEEKDRMPGTRCPECKAADLEWSRFSEMGQDESVKFFDGMAKYLKTDLRVMMIGGEGCRYPLCYADLTIRAGRGLDRQPVYYLKQVLKRVLGGHCKCKDKSCVFCQAKRSLRPAKTLKQDES